MSTRAHSSRVKRRPEWLDDFVSGDSVDATLAAERPTKRARYTKKDAEQVWWPVPKSTSTFNGGFHRTNFVYEDGTTGTALQPNHGQRTLESFNNGFREAGYFGRLGNSDGTATPAAPAAGPAPVNINNGGGGDGGDGGNGGDGGGGGGGDGGDGGDESSEAVAAANHSFASRGLTPVFAVTESMLYAYSHLIFGHMQSCKSSNSRNLRSMVTTLPAIPLEIYFGLFPQAVSRSTKAHHCAYTYTFSNFLDFMMQLHKAGDWSPVDFAGVEWSNEPNPRLRLDVVHTEQIGWYNSGPVVVSWFGDTVAVRPQGGAFDLTAGAVTSSLRISWKREDIPVHQRSNAVDLYHNAAVNEGA